MSAIVIREVKDADVAPLVSLWQECDLTRPWNDAERDISFARAADNATILIAEQEGEIAASAMVGHDGRRGWVYYVASSPFIRKQGLGRIIMMAAEDWLRAKGVLKLNVMVRSTNKEVLGFYERLGYGRSEVVCLQKEL